MLPRCIRCHLNEGRPQLIVEPDHGFVFVTDYGEPFEKNRRLELVRKYMCHAACAHTWCHDLPPRDRHAYVGSGAEIRYIQAMLGHSECPRLRCTRRCPL